jgi:hypoxanthine-DNA glycosylase
MKRYFKQWILVALISMKMHVTKRYYVRLRKDIFIIRCVRSGHGGLWKEATKDVMSQGIERIPMTLVHSFLPVEDHDAEKLILGSMPGKASLAAGQYYAHPRNHFWPIIVELFGVSADISYETRLFILKSHRIALWDVLASCRRKSSLDARIETFSEIINDFESFFSSHPRISDVFFNGRKAERSFFRKVLPLLGSRTLNYHFLPSTSPANASISYENKLKAWQELIRSR